MSFDPIGTADGYIEQLSRLNFFFFKVLSPRLEQRCSPNYA